MKTVLISHFVPGMKIEGFYYCVEKRILKKKDGTKYLSLLLQDKSGSIRARLWDNIDGFSKKFSSPNPVAIKGEIYQYGDNLMIKIRNINFASIEKYSKFGFNPAELIPESNINPTKLWEVLLNEVSLISKNHFKILVLKILKDQKNKFIVFPASISYQYNYQNGLFAQTISMVNSAKLLRKNYEFDYDLLLSGISLHQIGKLYSINVGFSNSSKSSNEKALLGNAILSKDLVGEYINQIPTFPKEDKIKLDHLILSYQGRREWMSPIEPQTIEAILLHTISYLDSQINILKR